MELYDLRGIEAVAFLLLFSFVPLLPDFNTRETTTHRLPAYVLSGYIQIESCELVDRTVVLIVGRVVMTLDLLTLKISP